MFWSRPGRKIAQSSDLHSFVLLQHKENCFCPKGLGFWVCPIKGCPASLAVLASPFGSNPGQPAPARATHRPLRETRKCLEQKVMQDERKGLKKKEKVIFHILSLFHSTVQYNSNFINYSLWKLSQLCQINKKLIFLKIFHLGLYLFQNFFKKIHHSNSHLDPQNGSSVIHRCK